MASRLLAAVLLMLLALHGQAASAAACPVTPANGPEQWHDQHVWESLAAKGYRIGKVDIQVKDVFELDNPVEDTWYGHLADALHRDTLPSVVRTFLVFEPAQPVDPLLIYQSIRTLHALSFLRYADIVPVDCTAGDVNVLVLVKDAWSLKFDLHFLHGGGQSNSGISFEDVDFYGTGRTVKVSHTADVQRTSNSISYLSPELFGSHWQLATTYSHLSDGHIESLDIGLPFYQDTLPWSFFVHYVNQQQYLNFYDGGDLAWRAEDSYEHLEFDMAHLLTWQGDTGTRIGASFLRTDYSYGLPQSFPPTALPTPTLTPRQFAGPALSWEYFQDRYASFVNMALIDRPEDYNLGWDTHLQLGYYAGLFNSAASAYFYDLNSTYGAGSPDDGTLFLGSTYLQGRREAGEEDDVIGTLSLNYYQQYFPWTTLVAHAEAEYSLHPDPEDLFYLGGLQGMLGYPNYLYIGDRRWLAHVEDRYLTQTVIWNTFQMGFAAYADVGKIHQLAPAEWSPTLADAGLAIRFGDIRSAYGGVIYVAYAWPLVMVPGIARRQFVIGNTFNF